MDGLKKKTNCSSQILMGSKAQFLMKSAKKWSMHRKKLEISSIDLDWMPLYKDFG